MFGVFAEPNEPHIAFSIPTGLPLSEFANVWAPRLGVKAVSEWGGLRCKVPEFELCRRLRRVHVSAPMGLILAFVCIRSRFAKLEPRSSPESSGRLRLLVGIAL